MKVSICITAYEAAGKGRAFIKRNLKHCCEQTYRPLEIVVSDHSVNSEIEEEVQSCKHSDIEIRYIRFEQDRGSAASNWNNAVHHASGDIIRILAIDDYLAYPDSIKDTVEWMTNNPCYKWTIGHRFDEKNNVQIKKTAFWNDNTLLVNTLSGPSCVTVYKHAYKPMDKQFLYIFDLDWYFTLYSSYGKPGFVPYITWVNVLHDNQLTHTVHNRLSLENAILNLKYGNQLPRTP